MPEIQSVLNIINQAGITGLLVVIVVALTFWITRRTVPRELYEECRSDIDDIRIEMRESIAPALDRLSEVQRRQVALQEEMWRHVEHQSSVINELSTEVRLIAHEMTMQRLNPPKRPH
ncbi:MAG: hypothetical protein LC737_06005 [Chloroflexi bacterium]|nr:hypothetical protein [Chloroflexota bacterium]